MPSFKSVALGASALAVAFTALTAPALADASYFKGVKSMDVFLPDAVPVVTVKNVAANKQLQNLNLAVQENTITVGVGGYVECVGITDEYLGGHEGYYLSEGAFGIGRTSLLMSESLPNSSGPDHIKDMDAHTFQMPPALLGNPQIGVDPVAAVLAAADQAPDRLAWLRQDHIITVTIPLRWESRCNGYLRDTILKKTLVLTNDMSYRTRDVDLKIQYKGDPQLHAVNAQLGQGQGLPGQIQQGIQPIKITKMNFQPNMPHHVGACPATTKIRIFYQGEGRGEIRIVVKDNTLMIHNSGAIPFNASNGQQHYDFEIETPQPAAFNINKTVSHNLSLHVYAKEEKAQVWPSAYKTVDNAVWNHRCTPQVNPVLGGTGGGKVGGYQGNGGNSGGRSVPPPLQVKPAVVPQPASPGRVQAPTDGDSATPVIRRAQ